MIRYQFQKENKYKAKKVPVFLKEVVIYKQKPKTGTIVFPSQHEADRFFELRMLLRAGKIKNLRLQEPYIIVPKSRFGMALKYFADFVYEEDGKTVVEDAKGVETDVYRLKKRLVAEKYGIIIRQT